MFHSAQARPSSNDMKTEALTYMYRSYAAMGKFNMVIGEIDNSSPAALRAIRIYAQFLQKPSPTSPALDEMDGLLAGVRCRSSCTEYQAGSLLMCSRPICFRTVTLVTPTLAHLVTARCNHWQQPDGPVARGDDEVPDRRC